MTKTLLNIGDRRNINAGWDPKVDGLITREQVFRAVAAFTYKVRAPIGVRHVPGASGSEGTYVVEIPVVVPHETVGLIAQRLDQLVIAAAYEGACIVSGLIDQAGNRNEYTKFGKFDPTKMVTCEQANPHPTKEQFAAFEDAVAKKLDRLEDRIKAVEAAQRVSKVDPDLTRVVAHTDSFDILGVPRGDLVSMRAAMGRWRRNDACADPARAERIWKMLDDIIRMT